VRFEDIMFPKRVNYRFFTDDEISKVSICELKSPVSFDRLGHPVPTGLYDQRLGPTEPGAKCVTCGLNYKHCMLKRENVSLSLYLFISCTHTHSHTRTTTTTTTTTTHTHTHTHTQLSRSGPFGSHRALVSGVQSVAVQADVQTD